MSSWDDFWSEFLKNAKNKPPVDNAGENIFTFALNKAVQGHNFKQTMKETHRKSWVVIPQYEILKSLYKSCFYSSCAMILILLEKYTKPNDVFMLAVDWDDETFFRQLLLEKWKVSLKWQQPQSYQFVM